MNGIGYIYKITNQINGMFYIGKTKDTIENRYKSHLKQALKNKELNITSSRLYNALNKYGVDNFTIEQIEECSYEDLSEREIYWINKLDARNPDIGYNICKGGECGPGGPMFAGHKHSEETRKQMSINRSGEKNSNFGNRWNQSDELKALHSKLASGENNGMYGKKHSDASKEKNRLSHIGKNAYSNIELDDVKMLTPEEAIYYLNHGYVKGNIHRKR